MRTEEILEPPYYFSPTGWKEAQVVFPKLAHSIVAALTLFPQCTSSTFWSQSSLAPRTVSNFENTQYKKHSSGVLFVLKTACTKM